jgi:O-antigen/teichoic acid export membrane protein
MPNTESRRTALLATNLGFVVGFLIIIVSAFALDASAATMTLVIPAVVLALIVWAIYWHRQSKEHPE